MSSASLEPERAGNHGQELDLQLKTVQHIYSFLGEMSCSVGSVAGDLPGELLLIITLYNNCVDLTDV
jgi:hypothetical protein